MAERDSNAPSIHLDSEEDSATLMTTSDYAQVVFQDVEESYLPGRSIACTYMLTQAIKPSSRDWIGIFKVGWSSTRQYLAFDWSPIPDKLELGKNYTQRIMLDAYYLPKEEDGEFYQFCYIDACGKMRGASTPFQFLRRPADEFVEVIDDSMDILMIQSKQQATMELQLQKSNKELENLAGEKKSLETQTLELRETVEKQNTEMTQLKKLYDALLKSHEDDEMVSKGLQHGMKTLEGRLEEVHSALVSLEQDKSKCEDTLQETIAKLHEMESKISHLNMEKEQLFKDIEHVCMEREEFKAQFTSSEKVNEEMRREVSSLMQQLTNHSEQTKVVKESETKVREEKRKMEQQLLVASADKEHLRTVKEKLKHRESQLATVEQNRKFLADEIDTMKTVNHKLSADLETAHTEKDAMKGHMSRKEKEFHDRQRQLQGQMRLMQHQAREKENLLTEQVQVLKDSIKQLSEEKEKALRGNNMKGPIQASQVAMKDLRAKLRKANEKAEDEAKKRSEMHKALTAVEAAYKIERNDFEKETNDLKTRLAMGADEYKKKYVECKTLEAKCEKLKKGQQVEGANEKIEESALVKASASASSSPSSDSKGTQSGLPAVAVANAPSSPADGGTFDSAELTIQLKDLMIELEDRNAKLKRYKLKYNEEKERGMTLVQERAELVAEMKDQEDRMENLEEEMRAKTLKQEDLQQKFNQLHCDYMQMKHSYESIKFDLAQSSSSKEGTPTKQRRSPPPTATTPQMSPVESLPMHFTNPYEEEKPSDGVPDMPALKFPNPYAEEAATTTTKPTAPPMSMPPAEGSLLTPAYPPDLPEPLKPKVMPEAKIAAIKSVTRMSSSDSSERESSEGIRDVSEERDEVVDEFHDAREIPEDGSIKKCPECSIDFPPSFPEEDFVMHIQQHFARQCPMCQLLMAQETEDDQEAFTKHVQTHFNNDEVDEGHQVD